MDLMNNGERKFLQIMSICIIVSILALAVAVSVSGTTPSASSLTSGSISGSSSATTSSSSSSTSTTVTLDVEAYYYNNNTRTFETLAGVPVLVIWPYATDTSHLFLYTNADGVAYFHGLPPNTKYIQWSACIIQINQCTGAYVNTGAAGTTITVDAYFTYSAFAASG